MLNVCAYIAWGSTLALFGVVCPINTTVLFIAVFGIISGVFLVCLGLFIYFGVPPCGLLWKTVIWPQNRLGVPVAIPGIHIPICGQISAYRCEKQADPKKSSPKIDSFGGWNWPQMAVSVPLTCTHAMPSLPAPHLRSKQDRWNSEQETHPAHLTASGVLCWPGPDPFQGCG